MHSYVYIYIVIHIPYNYIGYILKLQGLSAQCVTQIMTIKCKLFTIYNYIYTHKHTYSFPIIIVNFLEYRLSLTNKTYSSLQICSEEVYYIHLHSKFKGMIQDTDTLCLQPELICISRNLTFMSFYLGKLCTS